MRILALIISFLSVLFTLLLSVEGCLLYGQELHYEVLATNRSLESAGLEVLYADGDSRLWGGTKSGLFRLRKSVPIKYDLPDGRSLAVSTIFQRKAGNLWIGYDSGDIAYLDGDVLTYWEPEEGHPASRITGFAEDELGQLWMATYGEGLYCVSVTGRVFHFGTDDGPIQEEIYSIQTGPDGLVWAATDAGIIRCGFVAGEKIIKPFWSHIPLPDEIVLSLSAEEEGMWIGTHQGGLSYYDHRNKMLHHAPGSEELGPLTGLTKVAEKEVFALHPDGTVSRWQHTAGSCNGGVETGHPISRAMTFDREGNLWLFDNQEKLHFAQLRFSYSDIGVDQIQSVLTIGDQELLVGSQSGLYRGDPRRDEVFSCLAGTEGLNIISLAKIEKANAEPWLLAGTFGEGLLICTANDCQLFTEQDGLSNNNILSIVVTRDTAWLATLGGVTAIPLDALLAGKPVFKKITALGEQFIYQVIAAQDSGIWLATDGDGLIRYSLGEQRKYSRAIKNGDTLALDRIISAVYQEEGSLWVDSQEHGLFKLSETVFLPQRVKGTQFNSEESISALLVDASENLLVVYPGGVDIGVDKGDYWVSFGSSAGFRKGGSALNAYSAGKNGLIWFVAGKQLVKYQSGYNFQNRPVTLLRSIIASGMPIGKEQSDLAYNQNHLVFEYDGNWLSDPEEVTFRYRLRGQDLDWIYATDDRATYSNLPPGKYTFELQAGLYGQFEDKRLIQRSFRIWPAWWMSWWAILTYFLLILGIGYDLNKRQRLRRAEIARLENEKIVNELTALKAQVNPHFLFNSFSTLIATIEQSKESGIAYTEQLATFFRRVLGLSNVAVIPVSEEIDLVKNYFFLLEKRFGDKLELAIDVADQHGQLPPMCLQILVENAIKHNTVSRRRPLLIRIIRTANYLEVSNPIQPKLNQEPSSGFGLTSIRRRYEILGVDGVQVSQSENRFIVRLKIV